MTADGTSLRASPDLGGWRLKSPRDLILPLDPWAPAVLMAYADGVALGEVIIDPGLPKPDEAPLLWRAESPGGGQVLVPSVGGRSRGDRIWLLADHAPVCDPMVTVHDPLPGPGGQVWPLSGTGRIQVGDTALGVATGAGEDALSAHLLILANSLRDMRVDNGLPAFTGTPRFLGARGDMPLRDVTSQIRSASGRGLGVQRFDWIDEGEVIASTRSVLLPASLSVTLREMVAGLEVEVRGLPQDWRLAVLLKQMRYVLPPDATRITVGPVSADQGEVGLELLDTQGRTLHLLKPWPARDPMLIDALGQRLTVSRQVSLPSLLGWRGVLPQRGALELRMPEASHPVAFGETGTLRLAAWRPLLAQVQALTGADGLVDLQLVTDRPSPQSEDLAP